MGRVKGWMAGCMELEHDFMGFMMVEENFKAQYYVNCSLSFSLSFLVFSVQAFFFFFFNKGGMLTASCPLGARL